MRIIDDVLPMERVHELYNYFVNNKWDFQTKSPTVMFQNRSLRAAGLPTNKYFPLVRFPLHKCSDLLLKLKEYYPDHMVYDDFIGALMHPKDFSHCKHYDFFEDQHIGRQEDLIRIMYYCVPRWKPEWGGNTEFYGRWRNEKKEPDVCQIKPNRLLLFDWDECHTGTPWDNDEIQRIIISGYLFKKGADYAIKKTYRYIWGHSPTYAEVFPNEKTWKH